MEGRERRWGELGEYLLHPPLLPVHFFDLSSLSFVPPPSHPHPFLALDPSQWQITDWTLTQPLHTAFYPDSILYTFPVRFLLFHIIPFHLLIILSFLTINT